MFLREVFIDVPCSGVVTLGSEAQSEIDICFNILGIKRSGLHEQLLSLLESLLGHSENSFPLGDCELVRPAKELSQGIEMLLCLLKIPILKSSLDFVFDVLNGPVLFDLVVKVLLQRVVLSVFVSCRVLGNVGLMRGSQRLGR